MADQWYEPLIKRVPALDSEQGMHRHAVLIPLLKTRGEWQVLFEVRSQKLRRQPGEICLPGGKIEGDESPLMAALREGQEELLVAPNQWTYLFASDVLSLHFNSIVYPFVAQLTDYQGTFLPDEVDSILQIPLEWFKSHEPSCYLNHITSEPTADFPFHLIPNGRQYQWYSGRYPVYFYQYEDQVIWGLTARIIRTAVGIMRQMGTDLEAVLERL